MRMPLALHSASMSLLLEALTTLLHRSEISRGEIAVTSGRGAAPVLRNRRAPGNTRSDARPHESRLAGTTAEPVRCSRPLPKTLCDCRARQGGEDADRAAGGPSPCRDGTAQR